MSKNRKRRKQTHKSDIPKPEWPSWFVEPSHPAEVEVLFRVLQGNSRLSDIHFTVQMMQINYVIFRKNYAELTRLQQKFDQPLNFRELALQTDKGREIAQDTFIEFTRLLHNFLASAKMLVDVTRRWVRQQFENSEFLEFYEKEVAARFANNVQAQFLEDLRNFTLHRTLPLSRPELRFQEIDEHTLKSSLGIVLLKKYLLEWKNWSELGRIQISMAFEGEVDIISICKQYFENVTEFNRWLFWQVRERLDPEIDQINLVIERMRNPSK